MLTPAIKFHVSRGDEKSEKLLRRVCTALAYHVKDAVSCEDVGDALVKAFVEVEGSDEAEERAENILAAALGVRGGSRFSCEFAFILYFVPFPHTILQQNTSKRSLSAF